MKNRLAIIILLLGLPHLSAFASDSLKCTCLESAIYFISNLDTGKGLECNETFTTQTSDISAQEKYLKVYLNGSEKTQSDKDVTYHFRPRNDACLSSAYDEIANDTLWQGDHCNNSDEYEISGFDLKYFGEVSITNEHNPFRQEKREVSGYVDVWYSSWKMYMDNDNNNKYEGRSYYLQRSKRGLWIADKNGNQHHHEKEYVSPNDPKKYRVASCIGNYD